MAVAKWRSDLILSSDTVGAGSQSIRWKGREAILLSNGVVKLTVLTGGGHLADFRFIAEKGLPSKNVFWEAPWVTVDPSDDRLQKFTKAYGPIEIGKFLAGYTGHALCLDYFGAPSGAQAAAGLSIHGEAGVKNWNVMQPANTKDAGCRWNVRLPRARVEFEREIRLGNGESVVYVEERVHNERTTDHVCNWVQHATFGPPFLSDTECTLATSARRGMTSPSGYEDCSLLAKNHEFLWPHAPHEGDETSVVDLRDPFSAKGYGFVAGVQMDRQRKAQYILAVDWKLRLGVGYCFRQQDFPWMAIWEENCARQYSPWNGCSQARGMEFGTTPMPSGPNETFPEGELFDIAGSCLIPANGVRKARYLIFLVTIPTEINSIENVEAEGDAIRFYDTHGNASLSISAHGCEAFLSADNEPGGIAEVHQ